MIDGRGERPFSDKCGDRNEWAYLPPVEGRVSSGVDTGKTSQISSTGKERSNRDRVSRGCVGSSRFRQECRGEAPSVSGRCDPPLRPLRIPEHGRVPTIQVG